MEGNQKAEESVKLDEDGHIIVAENVPLIFTAKVTPISSVKIKNG